jgi:leucyl-tRNA synthetase
MLKELVQDYIKCVTILMSPITPHWCQHLWKLGSNEGFVVDASFPAARDVDDVLFQKSAYIARANKTLRAAHTKHG